MNTFTMQMKHRDSMMSRNDVITTQEVSQFSSSDDSLSAYTFFDSETWGVFYGYNQILIIFTIIISSYFLSQNVQLDIKCHKFLKDIHSNLSYILISINSLKKQYKYKNDINNNKKSKSYDKVKDITLSMVLDVIDLKCDEMIETIEIIRQYFKNKARKIVEKENNFNVNLDSNSKPVSHENMMISIQLATTSTTATTTRASIINSDMIDDKKDETNTQIMPHDLGLVLDNQNGKKEKKEEEAEKRSVLLLDPVIVNYVSKEMSKYDLVSNKKGVFKKFLGILWDIRKIMFMAFSHVFDTASDVALAIEWYILYKTQSKFLSDEYNVDMRAMFICCIIIIFYYRISSSIEIYQFSHSKMDVFLQFFFDFYLIKLIYVNVFKMKSYSPSKILKLMRCVEGQNESGFQSILTMVFLIKTNFGQFSGEGDSGSNSSSIIAILSFLFSFWSLTSRFIFLDSHDLQAHGRTIGINVNDFNFSDINIWYLFHVLFRLIEVLFSILIISLIWVVFGGIWLVLVAALLYLWMVIRSKLKSNVLLLFQRDFLQQLMVFDVVNIRVGFNLDRYRPFSRLNRRPLAQFLLFFFLGCWLLIVRVVLCVVIVIMYNNSNDDSNDNTTLSCIILSIVLIFLWFIMFVLGIKFYINRDHKASDARTATTKLNGIDIIASNDEESIIFCKELGIDVFKHKNYKKYNTGMNSAKNVLEAMIISNNIDNYSIIKEWYYDIGMKQQFKCDFDHFLKDELEWNGYTIEKLVYNCRDSCDYYKLIHDKLGLDMSLVDPKLKMNILHYAAYHGVDVGIIEWILKNEIIDDINAVNVDGWTCLHYLMYYIGVRSGKRTKNALLNERGIACLFISCGVDASIKDKDGLTAKEYLRRMEKFYDWLIGEDDTLVMNNVIY